MTLLELSTDLVLPPNGALWHELRNGIFPEIFFQCKFTLCNNSGSSLFQIIFLAAQYNDMFKIICICVFQLLE